MGGPPAPLGLSALRWPCVARPGPSLLCPCVGPPSSSLAPGSWLGSLCHAPGPPCRPLRLQALELPSLGPCLFPDPARALGLIPLSGCSPGPGQWAWPLGAFVLPRGRGRPAPCLVPLPSLCPAPPPSHAPQAPLPEPQPRQWTWALSLPPPGPSSALLCRPCLVPSRPSTPSPPFPPRPCPFP